MKKNQTMRLATLLLVLALLTVGVIGGCGRLRRRR